MTSTLRAPARVLSCVLSSLAFAIVVGCSSGEQVGEDTAVTDTADAATATEEAGAASADTAPAAPQDTAAADAGNASDSVYHRPADITMSFSGDEMYAGSYRAMGTSRMCGTPKIGLPGEENSFSFEFPFEGDFEIVDVSFSAKELTPAKPTTNFALTVAVRNKKGGRPPNISIRAGQPRSEDSGSATLAVSGETAELHITGKDFYGTLDMTIRCGKKAK